MKNKGFTLIELLVVLLLISVISLLVVPNVLDNLNKSKNNLSSFQKRNLKQSVELYLNDYCINPINEDYICPFPVSYNESGNAVVGSGTEAEELPLSEFLETGYMEASGNIEKCTGNITIKDNKVNINNITCNL